MEGKRGFCTMRGEAQMKFDSMFGAMEVYTVEYDDGERVRVMDVGGAYQSAVYLREERRGDLVFDYHRAYEQVLLAMPHVEHVLMLGGGGYAYPQYVVRNHPDVQVDSVEMDLVATTVARRYFGLEDTLEMLEAEASDGTGRLRLIEGDGRTYLEGGLTAFPNPGGYDLIVNDCFSGRVPAMRLATVEAAELIHDSLVPGGLYISNIISAVSGDDAIFLREIATTLLEVFPCVRVIPCNPDKPGERQNTVIVAGEDGETIAAVPGIREVPGMKDVVTLAYRENPSTID